MSATPANAPVRLSFGIGGFNGMSYEVEFSGEAIHVRSGVGHGAWRDNIAVTPSAEAWLQFWQAVDAIDVWQWQPEYFDHDVLDGTQWELELAHAGSSVKCEGSNAYPGANGPSYGRNTAFARFLKALRTLTGVKAIG